MENDEIERLKAEVARLRADVSTLAGKLLEAHEAAVSMNQTMGVIATSTAAAYELVGMLAGARLESISRRMEEIEEEMLAAAAPDSALALLAHCRRSLDMGATRE